MIYCDSMKEATYASIPRAPGASITVRVRINPGDHNLNLPANASDTVLDFKKLVYQKTTAENEVNSPIFCLILCVVCFFV